MKKAEFIKIMSGLYNIGSSPKHFVSLHISNSRTAEFCIIDAYIFQVSEKGESFICDRRHITGLDEATINFIEKWEKVIEEENK